MSRINILPPEIYNRIAAGEVIERPFSVVKELLENSLDAGATEIEVHIEKGGKQLIKVIDNGCGIERDDLQAAFMPHATSKIASLHDLDRISTLGFRGEALSSIAFVSRVELISSVKEGRAFKITYGENGMGKPECAALAKGTQISVRDLFYNMPVRARFMRDDKQEELDITRFVSRYILGNPQVAFRYYIDGKLHLQSYGGGDDEALAQVYGASTLAQCIKIDAVKDDVIVRGFLGNQNFSKPNKSYQCTFLNGRYVYNNTLYTALNQAYACYLMKRHYPFYVLDIQVPANLVDVNVHPNKIDVRFLNPRLIYGAVYSIVSSVLDGTAKAAEFVVDSKRVPEIKSSNQSEKSGASTVYSERPRLTGLERLSGSVPIPKKSDDEIPYYDPFENETLAKMFPPVKRYEPVQQAGLAVKSDAESKREQEELAKIKYEQQVIEYESCKYKGNFFNTYLIYEMRDTVYIIDQHAAHERLIYDRLREKITNRKIDLQGLIVPYLFSVNAEEKSFLEDNIDTIKSMGFDIAPFGPQSYRVNVVPADLKDINLEEFIGELLSDLKGLREIKLEEILKDKIATTACKHAVKGGMKLSDDEVSELFRQMKGNMGLKCPHGRPVCVTIEKKEIEKMFKRIV